MRGGSQFKIVFLNCKVLNLIFFIFQKNLLENQIEELQLKLENCEELNAKFYRKNSNLLK